jgi:hypothetical protein
VRVRRMMAKGKKMRRERKWRGGRKRELETDKTINEAVEQERGE